MARPILVKARFPGATGDRRSVTVCVHLIVDKAGLPRDIQVAAPRDAVLDKEAMAIVAIGASGRARRTGSRWRYPLF